AFAWTPTSSPATASHPITIPFWLSCSSINRPGPKRWPPCAAPSPNSSSTASRPPFLSTARFSTTPVSSKVRSIPLLSNATGAKGSEIEERGLRIEDRGSKLEMFFLESIHTQKGDDQWRSFKVFGTWRYTNLAESKLGKCS